MWDLEGNASNNALSLGIHLPYQNINIPPNKITGILWFSSELKVILESGIRGVTVSQHARDSRSPTLPHRLLYILKQTQEYSRSHEREELRSSFREACQCSVARGCMLASPVVCLCSLSLSSALNRGEAGRRWGAGKVWVWEAVPRGRRRACV